MPTTNPILEEQWHDHQAEVARRRQQADPDERRCSDCNMPQEDCTCHEEYCFDCNMLLDECTCHNNDEVRLATPWFNVNIHATDCPNRPTHCPHCMYAHVCLVSADPFQGPLTTARTNQAHRGNQIIGNLKPLRRGHKLIVRPEQDYKPNYLRKKANVSDNIGFFYASALTGLIVVVDFANISPNFVFHRREGTPLPNSSCRLPRLGRKWYPFLFYEEHFEGIL
jgi:hypothetical protein